MVFLVRRGHWGGMDALTLFGLFAVTFMLVCYIKEDASHWWTLAFAFGCVMGSAYGRKSGPLSEPATFSNSFSHDSTNLSLR